MQTRIALRLPRDASSVPFIRRLLDAALGALGVAPHIRDDIRIILSEACSNVVLHAVHSHEYTVRAAVDEEQCLIRIIDEGGGFDPEEIDIAPGTAEHGRGLAIMRALADDVRVTTAEHGAEVSVAKTLRFCDDAPACALRSRPGHHLGHDGDLGAPSPHDPHHGPESRAAHDPSPVDPIPVPRQVARR
ncbi:serine/threonine-protein kinase RsbW [Thermocatellispora tengchongensis]|uniref:Serine/threonine-protein kinase RsbW n=1 Tax=Thermocatellispora tengchongensis TaxID=1073253 RepID=A0A840PE47_9ACTN|nr:ATP-binding protein [Thermocatellispora tengchongensis]MBB5134315.1 serine/threonine-protein kinase RsbW [Thermocatellispora tengchongensis]